MNVIDDSFKHGKNFDIGQFCLIEPDVEVGDNVSLGSYVHLRSGTRFANNVHFGAYCRTTGICYLGNYVDARTAATVSKSVIVEDWVFLGPGIMTNHTKNVVHGRPHLEDRQLITRIGYGVIIGSSAQLVAGVRIGDNVVIGAGAVVTKDVLEPAVYVGNPLRKLKELPKEFLIQRPEDYKEHTFTDEMLKKYLPYYRGE